MQTNVGLAGKTVVTGLNWSVIAKSGPGRKKDIKKACFDSGLTLGVTVDGEDLAAIGLCVKKAEVPSGAAMLAAANALAVKERAFGDSTTSSNWILVERLVTGDKSGQYWMCAISDGVPVPGTDIIEDLTVTSAKLAELVEILENVEIFSTEQDILDYVAGATPSFEKGFAELTAKVSVTKALRPQKILGVPDIVYYAAFGLFALTMLAFAWSWYSEQQEMEQRRKNADSMKARMAIAKQEDDQKKTKEYQLADEAAKRAKQDELRGALSRNPASVVAAWYDAINGLPLNNGGWNIDTVNCDLAGCVVSLSRDEGAGTNASLKEIAPLAQYTEAGTASYVIALNIPASRMVSLEQLPAWSDFALNVGTSLQELKMSGLVEAKLGARKEVSYRPPNLANAPLPGSVGALGSAAATVASMTGAQQGPQSQAQPPKPLGYLSGNFSIRGTSLWQMKDAIDYIKSDEFSLDSVKVEFGRGMVTDAVWTVMGTFYLKGGDAGGSSTDPGRPQRGASAPSGMIPPGLGPQPPANQMLPVGTAMPSPKSGK